MDIQAIKQDFPILEQLSRGKALVYLDSASSAQKPKQVIEAISQFYQTSYANIHRGIYELSEKATAQYEDARNHVRAFINAKSVEEIVFVRGTTEAMNLVAEAYGRTNFQAGDEVILSEMEHHANIVPWLMLKEKIGIVIKVIPVKDDGSLDLEAYKSLFTPRTKLVSVTHASNVLGTINPVKEITKIAHEHNALVMLDGAQPVAHFAVDVQDIDCDFYAFSSHKLYGPTGAGALYVKKAILDTMPPYQGGGGMIETVSFDDVTYIDAPQKFEAGTPDIAGVIGMAAAIDYLKHHDLDAVYQHNQALLALAEKKLIAIPGLRIYGTAKPKLAVISFTLDGIHPHDIGTVLEHEGIAVRAGHHCAMPLMNRFNVPAMVRASFGIYNDESDIDKLVDAVRLSTEVLA